MLVVVLDPVPDDEIRTAIEARKEVADVNVHVVAPAASIGPLQWLTGAEDEARAEAAQLADRRPSRVALGRWGRAHRRRADGALSRDGARVRRPETLVVLLAVVGAVMVVAIVVVSLIAFLVAWLV